jgi:hypothetical protein
MIDTPTEPLMTLTIDPRPNAHGNVTESRRRVRGIREQLDRLDGLLAEVEAQEARGEYLLPATFGAHLLLKLVKFDRRLTALAEELSYLVAEELLLAAAGGGAEEREPR